MSPLVKSLLTKAAEWGIPLAGRALDRWLHGSGAGQPPPLGPVDVGERVRPIGEQVTQPRPKRWDEP